MTDDKYLINQIDDSVIDDSNLAQCECCGLIVDWTEVEFVNDMWSDGKISKCPECNEGETFNSYTVKLH
jgi:hypothetical protein